jgi:hypothetical protein
MKACLLLYSLNEPGARIFVTIATFKVGQIGHCLHNMRTLHRKFVKMENALGETKSHNNNVINFVSCIELC